MTMQAANPIVHLQSSDEEKTHCDPVGEMALGVVRLRGQPLALASCMATQLTEVGDANKLKNCRQMDDAISLPALGMMLTCADLVPMALAHPWVAQRRDERDVLLEALQFAAHDGQHINSRALQGVQLAPEQQLSITAM